MIKTLTKTVNVFMILLSFVLFTVFFIRIDPQLIYYVQQIVHLPLVSYLDQPGGISDYLSIVLIQLLYYRLTGIFFLIFLFLGLYILLAGILTKYHKDRLFYFLILISFLPVVLAISVYDFPFVIIIDFILALFVFWTGNLIKHRKRIIKMIRSLLTVILIFYLSGGAGLIFALPLILLISYLNEKDTGLLIIILLTALLIPVIFHLSGVQLTLRQLYFGSFITDFYRQIPLYLYASIILPVISSYIFYLRDQRNITKRRNYNILQLPLICFIIIVASLVVFSSTEKREYQIHKAASERNWKKIIELADNSLCNERIIQYQVNRALYQKHLLLENMFSYPQKHAENALLLEKEVSGPIALIISDLYYELGFLNASRHWANESYVILGNQPLVLKRLINCYLALNREKLAEKYFNILKASRVNRDWIKKTEKYLHSSSGLQVRKEFEKFHINNPKVDFFTKSSNPADNIDMFLRSNPDNRMAFEYYIAICLLQHKVGEVMNHIQHFKSLGYEQLPKSVQEAVLYWARKGGAGPDMGEFQVSNQMFNDFKDFSTMLTKSGGNKKRAKSQLAKYQNTYWYYLTFTSPRINQ